MTFTMSSRATGGRDDRRRRMLPRYGLILLLVNFLATAPLAAAEPLRILALGDSLTAGYGLAAAESFPSRLEAALRARGHDVRVINAGVSGDTSAGGLARLDWVLAEPPDAAIVELGANDGLRGLDPAQTEANLAAIVERLQGAGVPVLLAGMQAPPNLGRAYQDEFAAVYPRLRDRYGVALQPFFLDGVAARPELNQADGIHPNAAGVEAVVAGILPHVERLIEAARR